MAEENEQTVSREAHTRVVSERDTFKSQAEAAAQALAAAALVDKAYPILKDKVPDPYAAAKAVSRDERFAGVPDEELPDKVESWVSEWKQLFGANPDGSGATNDEATEQDSGPVAPPPGAARPAPNPGQQGGTPQPEPLTFNSPEVKAMRAKGDIDGIRQMIRSGRLKPSPDNPYGHLAKTS